jgi:hypothetical protein
MKAVEFNAIMPFIDRMIYVPRDIKDISARYADASILLSQVTCLRQYIVRR